MVVCGDFNSIPGSAAHNLLSTGRVDAAHPELATDPFGILRPPSKLQHPLPLVSAYTALTKQPCLESEAGPPPPPPYTTPVLNPHCLCSQLRALTLCVQLCTCL